MEIRIGNTTFSGGPPCLAPRAQKRAVEVWPRAVGGASRGWRAAFEGLQRGHFGFGRGASEVQGRVRGVILVRLMEDGDLLDTVVFVLRLELLAEPVYDKFAKSPRIKLRWLLVALGQNALVRDMGHRQPIYVLALTPRPC